MFMRMAIRGYGCRFVRAAGNAVAPFLMIAPAKTRPLTMTPSHTYDRPVEILRQACQRISGFIRRLAGRVPEPPPGASSILALAGPMALGAVAALVVGGLILHLHGQAMREAEHEQATLALVVADQAERAFQSVELVESALQERIKAQGIVTPDQFRARMAGAEAQADLRARGQPLPQLNAIVMVDADGNEINSTRPGPAAAVPVNVADREFFQALKSHPERSLFVGEPVRNRTNGNWVICIARRVAGPDGRFLGLIEGAMQLTYFETLYAGIAPATASAIVMYRRDGRLLARYPRSENNVGRSSADKKYFRALRATGEQSIVVRDTGSIDGTDLLLAGHSLINYPVVIIVTRNVSAILAPWRKQAFYLLGSGIVLELLVVVTGLLMLRQIRGQRLLTNALSAGAEAQAALLSADAGLADERERTDRAMRLQNGRFAAALGNMSYALCMFDNDDRLIVVNNQWTKMFGYTAADVPAGTNLRRVLELGAHLPPARIDAFVARNDMFKINGVPTYDICGLPDGRTLVMRFAPVVGDGWLLTYEDITEQRQASSRISHMAHHDALTGLTNREWFREKLTEAIARSRRGEPCALLSLDLDHFKSINETMGHSIGDAVLREVGKRLMAEVREIDTVARLGGDEFAILQSDVGLPQDIRRLAERLIEALGRPYNIEVHQITIGVSVGIAVAPADAVDPDQLLRHADLALFIAKGEGQGEYRYFEPAMEAAMQARRSLETDIRRALAIGEFEVFYQPLMAVDTISVSGFEALVRWRHPLRGVVSPADFVPFAEETGLIVPLGKWVLRQACADAAGWPDTIKVAVNVSVIQFGSPTLVQDVAAALADSGLAPERLELEITESVMLDNTEGILVILHQLRALGIGIAMDDFGTGYSSLSYLRRFPFSKVKIDRSFVEGLGHDADSNAIVRAVIDLCRTLGMNTLAEGVETEAQLAQLDAMNCHEVQGYLFSRPRPANEVAALCVRLADERPERIAGLGKLAAVQGG